MRVFLTYFKDSGKYYGEGEFVTDAKYMHKVTEIVRAMEKHPDLSGKWDGYILVTGNGEHAYPCLIVPERLKLTEEVSE